MKRRQSLVVLAAAALPALAADVDMAVARAVAGEWLSKVDGGNYSASWNAAATFRAAVTEAGWSSAVQSARQPLGTMRSRSEKSATPARSLPGAPDGSYVVIQYDTAFDQKANAVELVTVAQDPAGQWKVAGYFIQ